MTKSELIDILTMRQNQLSSRDVELAVKALIEQMSEALATGNRIEIRGFGSFSLHYRAPRIGRNPKTGESVGLTGKYVPHFKPGKELRNRVNNGMTANIAKVENTTEYRVDHEKVDSNILDSINRFDFCHSYFSH